MNNGILKALCLLSLLIGQFAYAAQNNGIDLSAGPAPYENLFARSHSMVVAAVDPDECDTTAECRAQYGDEAYDCVNSYSNESYCQCNDGVCSELSEPDAPAQEQPQLGDECDTTAQCKNIYGDTAYDCVNSQSDQSYCQCDDGVCSELNEPDEPPVEEEPDYGDECDTTAQCKNIYGQSANDCVNSRSDQSYCQCGNEVCRDMDGDTDPEPDPDPTPGGEEEVTGEMRQWHKVTITFDGPNSSETASTNPFTDYRMDVTFSNGDNYFVVPGYYAADGKAANSGASSGNKWRVHFSPNVTGTWDYSVSFRKGKNVVFENDRYAGQSGGDIDGVEGSFDIAKSNKTGRDFRGKGLLAYVDGRYLRFAGTGEYFLKQGADSPENLLAYADFDGGFKSDGKKDHLIKQWTPHVADWKNGDPTWKNGKGKGLIGAVNYIASEGLNAMSFLTMNINGDDQNVFPYTSYGERYRMDVSRLDQWEIVFAHMQSKGIFLHFKTQETENDQLLDGGNLGNQRKLYYRELIARFGHNLALNWNLGEETTQTTAQLKSMAKFFADNDPYQHPVVLHTYPGEKEKRYAPLLGNASKLHGLSMQMSKANFSDVHSQVVEWVRRSNESGRDWVVSVDEPGDASHAMRPDNDAGNSHVDGRKNGLWGTFMGGGTGNEWYFGYSHAHSDLSLQDFRSRDKWWDVARYALEFFNNNDIPFWNMKNDNNISTNANDYGFYKHNDTYVVYLKQGGTTELNLNGTQGSFNVYWYNPRSGGALQQGSVKSVSAGGYRALGNAPSSSNSDWVILVRKGDDSAPVEPDNGLFIEKDGLVIMETESTKSNLGKWQKKQSVSGFTGSGHIEFTGNGSNGGPATSPLTYTFKVSKAGDYQLYIRAHKRLDGQPSDKNNDGYVRMVGNFSAGAGGADLAVLKKDTKLYGGNASGWGWARKLNPSHDEHLNPVYKLKANTEYSLIVSGRSIKWNIDRLVLRHSSVSESEALNTSLPETK
ncbi:DUF5060 domain-containing protein [Corallincola holothuriorum]|nr:DUF5060 domain-containing protein [Corallincola holothuriorum]